MTTTHHAAKTYGYARVSTRGQDHDRQHADLLAAGIREDDVFTDHGVSGGKMQRPQLERVLELLQDGDTLTITTLDRLGRDTAGMLQLAHDLRERGVNLRILNMGGQAVDTSTPTGKLLFTMMAGLAEMELEVKRERNRDSVAKRRAAGKNVGGRPRVANEGKLRMARAALADPEDKRTAAEVAADLGMSRATMFRRLKELEETAA